MISDDSKNCVIPATACLPDNIVAFTTTRLGGVSAPPFDSMNLGLHVDDDKTAVLENRSRLAINLSLPDSPLWLNQTHSTKVERVLAGDIATRDADGAFTCEPGQVLAVLTADCLPVVISSANGRKLAVLHAGWRGLANGIVSNAMSLFGSDNELQAWLGPAIGATRFEVGADVRDAFSSIHTDNHQHFTGTANPGKYMADLYALARAELARHGCVQVSGGDHCTYNQPEMFHSYRRDGARTGRMATVAWIRES